MLWLWMLSGAALLCIVDAARFLVMPVSVPSHTAYLTKLAKGLLNNGHVVDMILSPNLDPPEVIKSADFRIINYQLKLPEQFMSMPKEYSDLWMKGIGKSDFHSIAFINNLHPIFSKICTNVLSDQQLFNKLSKMKYDLAIVDGVCLNHCMYVLLYRLGIPYISLVTQYDPWMMGIPTIPSSVPFAKAGYLSDKMNFGERIYNLYQQMHWALRPRISTMQDELVSKYAPEKPFVSMVTLARKSVLWFLNTDNAMDYARPTMPHIVYTGGLTAGPAKPLIAEYSTFLDNSQHGVILLSFGSIAQMVPAHVTKMFLAAFKQIKLDVFWKYSGEKLDAPSRIKLVSSWIPQNDILGHPKICLFITHGGNNGQFEALYHGVPMLVLPLFGDQFYNVKRIEDKGYGRGIWMENLTAEIILENINLITKDPSFRENIQKGSQIFRSAPMTAVQKGVYWAEHVIKHGGSYLRSHSLDMPGYQYWMVDVLGFLALIIIVPLVAFICCLKYFIRKFCALNAKDKTE